MRIMRHHFNRQAGSSRAFGILLAVVLLASLITGAAAAADAGSGPAASGAATPTILESSRKTGSQDAQADSRQPGGPDAAAPSAPQPASSPLATSSPLSHTTPTPASPTPASPTSDASAAQARSSAAWTVSFDTAGGSSIGSQTIPDGSQASRPTPDPARDGYLFDGWFQDNIAYDFTQPVTGSTTLTARWTSTDTQHWTISPSQGPAAGGTKTTLTPPKPRGIRFSQVSAGRGNDLAIGSDGNLYSWGCNGHGQQGDGTTIERHEPVRVLKPEGAPQGFTWVQASAGYMFSLALGSDGNIYSWGDNESATLGRDIGGKTINGIPCDGRPGKVDKPAGAPEGFTWKHVEAGSLHALALGSDGQLYSWGLNDHGYVGNGTTTPQYTPVRVSLPEHAPSGFTWKRMSGWGWHSLALGSDNQLYSWGYNGGNCELGTGQPTPDRLTPVPVARPEGVSSWGQFRMGDFSSVAIGSDGNAYGWGYGGSGSIGNGATDNGCSPTKTKPAYPGQSWKQVSILNRTSLGLDTSGRLYAWGDNTHGQIGDGTTTDRHTPVQVAAPADGPAGLTWVQVSAGWDNLSYGLASDGNLYSWGSNTGGQLGANATADRNRPGVVGFPGAATPTSVLFGQAKTTGITAGPGGTWQAATPEHDPGTVDVTVSWDRNGPQPDAHLQYTFTAPGHQVGFASANGSCPAPTGMPASQTVVQGGQAERPYPDPKAEGCLFDGWFQGDVAYDFTQPVTHDTTLTARWTREDTQHWAISPTQGPESGGTEVTLTPPAQRGIRFSQISLGEYHSAAIGSDGNLYAWGRNSEGQLGDGTTTSRSTPVMVDKPQGAPDGFTWKQVILGGWQSAAFGSDGNLYIWGYNAYGQLGDGTTTNRNRPVMVDKPQGAPEGFTWKQVGLSWEHSAAIGSDGSLYTWGGNNHGQLGDGTTTNRNRPVLVDKPTGAPDGFTWKQIALGGHYDAYSAAIGSDGQLYTWGYNSNGQLGDGTTNSRSRPVLVDKPTGAPDGFTWTQLGLGAGGISTAAFGSDGGLYIWGYNANGQLGDGTTTNSRYRPGLVDKPTGAPDGFTWTQASRGFYHSAAMGSDGSLYTWGYNGYGQLGDGTATDRHRPTLVGKPQGAPDGFTWKQASLGWYHSAAIGSDGQLYTWGWNGYGQMGRDPSSAWPASRPGPVGFPGKPQATNVCFGQNQEPGTCSAAGKGLAPNSDGTWKVATPPYTPGMAPVAIDWTQDGKQQQTDTSNTYRYLSIASLPLTGGDGMLLLLATGLLAAGAATAAKSRRRQTRTAA